MNLKNILATRGLTEASLPLWRLRLTDEEFVEIKQLLKEEFASNKRLFLFAKEATLYYAYWWSKEYIGGIPSREKVAEDLGIKPEQSVDLYSLAKRGLSQLKISPIIRNGRTHRFRTLLLQGGLPLKSLEEGNNKANYGAFLEGLIKYTNEVEVDYDNIKVIHSLPFRNRLSSSFQTEDFYELNLLIIEDFREKGEESEYWGLISTIFDKEGSRGNLSLQRIKELLSERKERDSRRIKSFSVEWSIRNDEAEASLYYTLILPQSIHQRDVTEVLQDEYEFSVFLNNKEVAKYYRASPDDSGNISFVKVRGKNSFSDKQKGDDDVVIRLSSNGRFFELFHQLPDFSEPILLTGHETVWHINKKKLEDPINAVLLLNESEWEFTSSQHPASLIFYGKDALWVESKEPIVLINRDTNEDLVFDNTPNLYRYEISHRPEVISKNRILINSKTKFRIIYTVEETRVNKGFQIYFRLRKESWILYKDSDNLPSGLLYFKFIYPDGKTEYAKFFNLRNLSAIYSEQSTGSGVIALTGWNGFSTAINEQQGIKGIEQIADNKWMFLRDPKNRHYASHVKFRITDQQGSSAEIAIDTPFKGVVITDFSRNSIIDDRSTIDLHSLHCYQCLVFGESRATITIYHNKNENNQRKFTYSLDQKNRIPLSDFDESVKNLFLLFGSDHTDYDSLVTLKVNNTLTICIRPFNLTIDRKEWEKNKTIRLNDNAIVEELSALTVDCEYPDEILTFELEKRGNDFVLPENRVGCNGIIVFSNDTGAVDKVRPTFLGIAQNTSTFDERLSGIRAEIDNARFIDNIWEKTAIYFRLLLSNNLPFRTVDYFRIVAETPLSMAKLSLVLLDERYKLAPEERLNGLLAFENEFALAWHWIDIKTWKEALNWYKGKFDDIAQLYIEAIISRSLEINHEDSHQLYSLIAKNVEPEDCFIDEQKHIQDYTRFVDINSDDWLLRDDQNWIVYPRLEARWQKLFRTDYGAAIRTFLWGGAKAALSAMEENSDKNGNKSLWNPENEMQRRITFYYWKLNPKTYTQLFLGMLRKINYKLNN